MPAPVQDVFVTPATSLIQFNQEPAYSAFHILALLAKSNKISGLGEWITKTHALMTGEEKERHRLVMHGLFYAAIPDQSWPSFAEYIDYLKSAPPELLQDKLLNSYAACIDKRADSQPVLYNKSSVLSDFDSYLNFLAQCFEQDHIDADFELKAFAYISDPLKLQEIIVDHLSHMWSKYLREEWLRVDSLLEEAVQAFRQVDYSDMTRDEIFEFVTGRKIPEESWTKVIYEAGQITFMPSAHIGPYVGQIEMAEGIGIVFGARMPEGADGDIPDLSRAEILVRLGALADDTRLQILRTVGESGEMRSQDIMKKLNLSQSATSRHLSQLNATGYLIARRCEGAKCYRLNIERLDDTLKAVSTYLTIV